MKNTTQLVKSSHIIDDADIIEYGICKTHISTGEMHVIIKKGSPSFQRILDCLGTGVALWTKAPYRESIRRAFIRTHHPETNEIVNVPIKGRESPDEAYKRFYQSFNPNAERRRDNAVAKG